MATQPTTAADRPRLRVAMQAVEIDRYRPAEGQVFDDRQQVGEGSVALVDLIRRWKCAEDPQSPGEGDADW